MATEPMTAPRKPVAWMRREVTYRGVDGRTDGERVVSERRVMADDIPLYTDLNLQPLWALVETWEKDGAECRAVATDQEEQGYGEDAECNYSQAWRFEECAAALRQLLEAMQ